MRFFPHAGIGRRSFWKILSLGFHFGSENVILPYVINYYVPYVLLLKSVTLVSYETNLYNKVNVIEIGIKAKF